MRFAMFRVSRGCLGHISKGPVSCAVNPACGRETIYGLSPADKKKKVLIAGGGIAGCEAARVLAERGHDVELYEKSDRLGGNLIPGGVPSFKSSDHKLVAWYETQLKKLNIKIVFNHALTESEIRNSDADVIITATGSKPITFTEGVLKDTVTADDILMNRKSAGEKIVIIGGGLVGCETGLWLAKQGKSVTIIEMQKEILGGPHGLPFMNYSMLVDLMNFHHMDIFKEASVTGIDNGVVTFEKDGNVQQVEADTVIAAVGYRSENALYESLKDINKPIYNIGDSCQVHNIMYAIWNAYEIARNI